MTVPHLSPSDLDWLRGLARALVRDAHGAEDLVQDTAAAALAGPMPEGAAPRAWLASVARRIAARELRSDGRRRDREAQVAQHEEVPSDTGLLERAELGERVLRAVRRLQEPHRRTILLRFLERLEPKQIAQRDGVPVDTVRWRLRRGLELLRVDLGRQSGVDELSLGSVLLPLAHGGVPQTPGAAGALAGTFAVGSIMKTGAFALTALLGIGLFLAWNITSDEGVTGEAAGQRRAPDARSAVAPSHLPASSPARRAEAPTTAQERRAAVEVPFAQAPQAAPPAGAWGTVLDTEGAPIAGATAYIVVSAAATARTQGPPVSTVTGADGRFQFEVTEIARLGAPDGSSAHLGVHANGFLRQVVPAALGEIPEGGWRIVLEKGRVITGRVVDPNGVPVSSLSLLAHTSGGGIEHMSPSQRRLRSERAALAGAESPYYECRATTDAAGNVRFSGLAPGRSQILSMDPGWSIEDPRELETGGPFVVWTAVPRLGVEVTVTDPAARGSRVFASATFRVELTFNDGSSEDVGQWVGRGEEAVSLVLGQGALPDYGARVITAATFYGTVEAEGRLAEWRAATLQDPLGVTGVAVATATLPQQAAVAAGDAAPPLPKTATLLLDMRYTDGTPFSDPPIVKWTSAADGRRPESGTDRPSATAPGRFAVKVPAGSIALEIASRTAQGSLAPWTGSVDVEPSDRRVVAVTLTQGGAVSIARPSGFEGLWVIHASWRDAEDDPWQGSWTYSTDEEALRLTAMRPATWRFRLRRAGRGRRRGDRAHHRRAHGA